MSCGGEDCRGCTELSTGNTMEQCNEPDILYTDISGNVVTFEESLESLESAGNFECE